MFKSDAIAYFGTQQKIADAFGITKGSVSQWGDVVPELRAHQIEKMTKGKLKFNPLAYQYKKAS